MTNEIHDIKGLVPVPGTLWWLWALLGVILLLALVILGIWLWKRRKHPIKAVPIIPPPPPHEIALHALARLREENPETEPFYTRLSNIVRHYLEGKFNLRAPEQTTEEFLREVSTNNALSDAHKELLGAFLQEADMVKFARLQPTREDRDRAFEAARRFVLDTSQPPVPSPIAS